MTERTQRNAHTELVAGCLEILRLRGILAWKQQGGVAVYPDARKRRFVRYGVPGLPDIAGVLPGGRALFVECKTGSGRARAKQKSIGAELAAQGACVLLVRTVDGLLAMLPTDGN